MSADPQAQQAVPNSPASPDADRYQDPHADAQSSLTGTAGPEGQDPADAMATEPPPDQNDDHDESGTGTPSE